MQIRRSFALSFGLAVLLTGSTAIAQSNSSAAARQWFLSSHLFQTSSGITINYAEQGDPQGPVLVFLHGGGDSWHSWDRVFPLIPARYHVYALTLRGHGLSDHPEHGYATDDFAADVLDFLKQKEIHQATLIGHSLGSFVAQRQSPTVWGAGRGRPCYRGSHSGFEEPMGEMIGSSQYSGVLDISI